MHSSMCSELGEYPPAMAGSIVVACSPFFQRVHICVARACFRNSLGLLCQSGHAQSTAADAAGATVAAAAIVATAWQCVVEGIAVET